MSSLQQIFFQLHVQMFYTKCIFQDIIMNFVGTVMFVAVGGVALHYWTGYQTEHKYVTLSSEKQVGIAVGSLCIVEGAIYLLDTVLSCIHFAKDYDLKWVWRETRILQTISKKGQSLFSFLSVTIIYGLEQCEKLEWKAACHVMSEDEQFHFETNFKLWAFNNEISPNVF